MGKWGCSKSKEQREVRAKRKVMVQAAAAAGRSGACRVAPGHWPAGREASGKPGPSPLPHGTCRVLGSREVLSERLGVNRLLSR